MVWYVLGHKEHAKRMVGCPGLGKGRVFTCKVECPGLGKGRVFLWCEAGAIEEMALEGR